MAKSVEDKDPQLVEAAKKRHFTLRLNVFFFSTFILFSILIVRLAYLQFVLSDEMQASEWRSKTASTPIAPIRGNIFDRNGYPIAYTESTQSLYFRFEPGQDRDSVVDLAKRLTDVFAKYNESAKQATLTAEDIIVRMDVGYDLNKVNTVKRPGLLSQPRRIKEGLSQREIAYIMEHKDEFRGMEIMEESIRNYDSNTIAVQLVGYLREFSTARNQDAVFLERYRNQSGEYLNQEYVGFDGLELMYQDELRGTNGSKSYSIDAQGKIIGLNEVTSPRKGNNLVLSLDKDIQLATENAIMAHLQWLKSDEAAKVNPKGTEAVAGYAVAMEVATGHVVAMASMPDYDTNVWRGGISTTELEEIRFKQGNGAIRQRYADLPGDEYRNHPSSLVPLGSTIKPLSVLVGLNEGLFTPQEKFLDTGVFVYGKDESKVRNSGGGRGYGSITASTAIQKSSNVFMAAMVGNRLYRSTKIDKPLDVWDDYMKQFGLGITTGSGLPGESSGVIDYYDSVKTSSTQAALIFASFGQQGRYTPLQLAQYVTTLANRGKRLKPQFVEKITDYDGNVIKQFDEPVVLNEVSIPDKYWETIEAGMLTNVHAAFDGFPYDYRRKTGTSEQDVARMRVENAVFIAYAPAKNPTLAVAVVVPNGGFGSYGAAPIARSIFDAYDEKIGLVRSE